MADDILTFSAESWAKLDDEKKRYLKALYLPPQSPLLVEQRPNTSSHTRALVLWNHYRESLTTGGIGTRRVLNLLKYTDREASLDRRETEKILEAMHRDAQSALDATATALSRRDAYARGDIEESEVPSWALREPETLPAAIAAGPGGPDPQAGRVAPGSLLPSRYDTYAIVLTQYGSVAEAKVLADILRWARLQDPFNPPDTETVLSDFERFRPEPWHDRVGPAVALVASRFYPNRQAIAEFVSAVPAEFAIIAHGTLGGQESGHAPLLRDLARTLGRSLYEAVLTPAADKTAPHDIRRRDALGRLFWLRSGDYCNAIVLAGADIGKEAGATQQFVNHKIVDLASHVVTFDDGHGDWGVRQTHHYALASGKLHAAFDSDGKRRNLAEIHAADRHYLLNNAENIRSKLPRDLELDSTKGVLLLSNLGLNPAHMEALRERFAEGGSNRPHTLGDVLETIERQKSLSVEEVKSHVEKPLPVPAALRERLSDTALLAKAVATAEDQLARATAGDFRAVGVFDPGSYPPRLRGEDLAEAPAILWIKGNLPDLSAVPSAAIAGTTKDAGPRVPWTAETLRKAIEKGGQNLRLASAVALRPGPGGAIEIALPELSRASCAAALRPAFAPKPASGFQPIPEHAAPAALAILAALENGRAFEGLSDAGKAHSMLAAAHLAKDGITVFAPLDTGAPLFALHGAAAAGGAPVAIAPTALDNLQHPAILQAAESVLEAGGAVISVVPPGNAGRDKAASFELCAGLADATILTEAPANDVSLVALEAASRLHRPVLAIEPQTALGGRAVSGNRLALLGPGRTAVETETRALAINTTHEEEPSDTRKRGFPAPARDPRLGIRLEPGHRWGQASGYEPDGLNDQSLVTGGTVHREIAWQKPALPLDPKRLGEQMTLAARIVRGEERPEALGRTVEPPERRRKKVRSAEEGKAIRPEQERFVKGAMGDYRQIAGQRLDRREELPQMMANYRDAIRSRSGSREL